MALPVTAQPASLIETLAYYEKSLIALVGETHLFKLFKLAERNEGIRSYYQISFSDENMAALNTILEKTCLLSLKYLELEKFVTEKSGDSNIPECINTAKKEMADVMKDAFSVVNNFSCRKIIETEDLEMLKRYKALNKGWSEDILGFAREYARYGSDKAKEIVAWIESEEPAWK